MGITISGFKQRSRTLVVRVFNPIVFIWNRWSHESWNTSSSKNWEELV